MLTITTVSDGDGIDDQQAGERCAGELAALIGVDDLRRLFLGFRVVAV
jgi:hypothetical protein